MKFKHKMEFNTTEELNLAFELGNKELSDLIVDETLKNLKNKKKKFPIVSITTLDDDLIYEVMVERPDIVLTLTQNLEVMEEYEDYERCSKIVEGIKFLENK